MQRENRFWGTEIRAIDPMDGEMKTWAGPIVPGITYKEAKRYCSENGLGYCKVIKDQLIMSVPCKNGTIEPDWDKKVVYVENEN